MKNYLKYRWFFTLSGKLVVGGKNAEQNDELLKEIKESNKEHYIMHTSHPGSPFSIIICDFKEVGKKDLEECAIFTGCFSKAWKEGKKKTRVHIFSSEQVHKDKIMKTGTWGVRGKVKESEVELKLVLAIQENHLRAVPEKSVKQKDILLKIKPGKTDKIKMIEKFMVELDEKFKSDEILSALPAGGVKIVR